MTHSRRDLQHRGDPNIDDRGLELDAIGAAQPIPLTGAPGEVAKAILYLVANATYSNDIEFIIDGGSAIGQIPPT